jgi:hypothetical protein
MPQLPRHPLDHQKTPDFQPWDQSPHLAAVCSQPMSVKTAQRSDDRSMENRCGRRIISATNAPPVGIFACNDGILLL